MMRHYFGADRPDADDLDDGANQPDEPGGPMRMDEEQELIDEFQDPGGNSALRRATATNPRNLPCPTCGKPNMLTPRDVALGYQCDGCADRAEGGGY